VPAEAGHALPGQCPICARELQPTRVRGYDRLVTGDGPFAVRECRSCRYGVTEISGPLERFYPPAYYEEFYEHGGAPSSPLHRARARWRRRALRRRLARPPFAPRQAPGRVLDVGCGGGELLEQYGARGWSTFGVDPAPQAVAAARGRGATVHEGTLEDRPWPAASFDLITFSHSLEHLPRPLAELRAARELLVPGGRIAIEAPNWRCWQRWIFRGRWFPLDLPRHLQHFSPRALRRAAAALELEPEAIGTRSTVIAAAYSIDYLIAGRWSEERRLWLAYALGLAVFPLVWAIDRFAGGDCCYAVLRRAS
jgi:SAM-dependent methyltransferase